MRRIFGPILINSNFIITQKIINEENRKITSLKYQIHTICYRKQNVIVTIVTIVNAFKQVIFFFV